MVDVWDGLSESYERCEYGEREFVRGRKGTPDGVGGWMSEALDTDGRSMDSISDWTSEQS